MMMAVMVKLSHLCDSEITWSKNGLSNFSSRGRLFLFAISQNEIGELKITVAGGFGVPMDDRARRLLGMLAQQLLIDPQAKRMVVGRGQNGALRARLGLLHLCRHIYS